MKGKTSKIIRLAASICLIIGGAIFLIAKIIWHWVWGGVLANICMSSGAFILIVTLRKIPMRGDERTKMIFDKSSRNAFLFMLTASFFMAFYTTVNTMDINLFAFFLW